MFIISVCVSSYCLRTRGYYWGTSRLDHFSLCLKTYNMFCIFTFIDLIWKIMINDHYLFNIWVCYQLLLCLMYSLPWVFLWYFERLSSHYIQNNSLSPKIISLLFSGWRGKKVKVERGTRERLQLKKFATFRTFPRSWVRV